jgi:hypothetical protein
VTGSGRANDVQGGVALHASRCRFVAVPVAEFVRADHLGADHLLRDGEHVGREVRRFEREAAFDQYATDDIEIDDEPAISRADDGTWVAAWVWIADPEEEEEDDEEEDEEVA